MLPINNKKEFFLLSTNEIFQTEYHCCNVNLTIWYILNHVLKNCDIICPMVLKGLTKFLVWELNVETYNLQPSSCIQFPDIHLTVERKPWEKTSIGIWTETHWTRIHLSHINILKMHIYAFNSKRYIYLLLFSCSHAHVTTWKKKKKRAETPKPWHKCLETLREKWQKGIVDGSWDFHYHISFSN